MKSMIKIMGGLGLALGALTLNPQSAKATCAADSYISTICWTAATYCPRNFGVASGGLVSISSFQALYSLVGTTFGGNGITTFGIPDLRGRAMVGAGQGPGLTNVFRGQIFGQEDIVFTTNEMPAHNHTASVSLGFSGEVQASSAVGDETSPQDAYPAARQTGGAPGTRRKIYNDTDTPTASMAGDIAVVTTSPSAMTTDSWGSPTGSTSETGLRPPQLGLLPCIALQGVYPPRS
ncbi:MAG: phage tail protein [Magnetovibrionaceae bacterium]